mmetsp:Transcript_24058/g.54276  ORF Transcript_24058/g.54276 Transcript_24058/m.54276 type:complete len:209 (+) Transcript_24058:84-710(+)
MAGSDLRRGLHFRDLFSLSERALRPVGKDKEVRLDRIGLRIRVPPPRRDEPLLLPVGAHLGRELGEGHETVLGRQAREVGARVLVAARRPEPPPRRQQGVRRVAFGLFHRPQGANCRVCLCTLGAFLVEDLLERLRGEGQEAARRKGVGGRREEAIQITQVAKRVCGDDEVGGALVEVEQGRPHVRQPQLVIGVTTLCGAATLPARGR